MLSIAVMLLSIHVLDCFGRGSKAGSRIALSVRDTGSGWGCLLRRLELLSQKRESSIGLIENSGWEGRVSFRQLPTRLGLGFLGQVLGMRNKIAQATYIVLLLIGGRVAA